MKNSTIEIINDLCNRYNSLDVCKEQILKSLDIIIYAYKNGNKLLTCGNGGSASDSMHIVGELMKAFKIKRPLNKELVEILDDEYMSSHLEMALPTVSLVSEASLTTAYSNDQAPDLMFAQQVLGHGKRGDVLLCISTSGNSKNCVYAAKMAKALDVLVISLTGEKPCKLDELSDVVIKAPSCETYKIQELHLPIYHALCLAIENEFFGE